MKKTLSVIILAAMLMSLLSVFAFAQTVITTPQMLIDIANNPSGNYILGCDIDMQSNPLTGPVCQSFSGTLDGAGYEIKNISIVSDGSRVALFDTLTGTVKNITISGSLSVQSTATSVAAATVAVTNNGTIEKVLSNVNITVKAKSASVGGICTLGTGKIISCENIGSITVSRNAQTEGGNFRIGGIAAGFDYIHNCVNKGTITAGDNLSSVVFGGGIVAENNNQTENLKYNINRGSINISALDQCYAGGIIGLVKNKSIISLSENGGNIKAEILPYAQIDDDMNTVNPTADAVAGGIVANVSQSVVLNCGNYGSIRASKPQDTTVETIAGGIAGKIKSDLTTTKCFDMHTGVLSGDKTGAICGETNKDVIYCYYASTEQEFTTYQGLAVEEITNEDAFEGFDFDNIWTMKSNPVIDFSKYVSTPGIELPDLPVNPDPQPQPKPEVEIKDTSKIFADIKEGAWYKEYVDYAYSYGIFSGTDKGFSPDVTMTRAQFVQVFANISGVNTDDNNVDAGFTDVKSGAWYASAVKWAAENGVVSGIGNGLFAPNAPVTREQMCVMIVNYIKNYQKGSLKQIVEKANFNDDAQISSWAKEDVYLCQMAELISGTGTGSFAPKATATRAVGATIFTDFHKSYIK